MIILYISLIQYTHTYIIVHKHFPVTQNAENDHFKRGSASNEKLNWYGYRIKLVGILTLDLKFKRA